jgi:hypothetical protein
MSVNQSPETPATVPNESSTDVNNAIAPPDVSTAEIVPALFSPGAFTRHDGLDFDPADVDMPKAAQEPKRGRGRPKGRKAEQAESAAQEPEQAKMDFVGAIPDGATNAAAVMIVGTMDMLLHAISEGEYTAPDKMRKNYLMAWENYLRSIGKEPPPWVLVTLMTVGYASPAFQTPAATGKFERFTNKLKGWWVSRFGG